MAKKRSIPRRILKWTGITIATLIVLIIIAVLVIPHVVNTGPVKHEIERIASTATGRTVTISGPISLSLFPWVGFDAKNLDVANPPGFPSKPFMKVKELEVHVEIIPLLFHNIKVSGITLDAPAIALVRAKNGRGNWEKLGNHQGRAAKAPKEKRGAITKLYIGRVAINNGTVSYRDARSGKSYTIRAADLEASGIAPGKDFPIHLDFKLASDHPHFRSAIKLDTRARYDAAADTITFANGLLLSTITQAGLGAESLPVNLQWQRIVFDRDRESARFDGLALKIANLEAKWNGNASAIGSKPALRGRLEIPTFAPRPFFAAIGKPIPTTVTGLAQASLAADLDADAGAARLTNLRLVLGAITLGGSIAITDFATKALRFDLATDRLDLDRYIPRESKPAAPVAGAHGKSFTETRLPATLVQNRNVAGVLKIGQLTGFGIDAKQVELHLKSGKNSLSADPITASLYGGQYHGAITATAAGAGMRIDATQKLTRVNVGQLLQALSGSERLSGTGSAKVRLAGSGDTIAELLDGLKGPMSLHIEHGALEGVNLWQSLAQAYVLLTDHRKIPINGPNRTEFSDLEATAKLADGILDSDAMSARLPHMDVSGEGSVNFKTKSVDYRLLAEVGKAPKVSGADLSRLDGLTVPLHVSGSFSDLSVMPDVGGVLEAKAKSQLQKKLDEQKASLQDKLKKKLQDMLGGDGGGG